MVSAYGEASDLWTVQDSGGEDGIGGACTIGDPLYVWCHGINAANGSTAVGYLLQSFCGYLS